MKKVLLTAIACATIANAWAQGAAQEVGKTEITKWPQGKRGAVSITYDDGSINQFRVAVPIMDRLGLPGTFYINTGSLAGSTWTGRHVGRPWQEIAAEAKTIPTSVDNVFERASAARFIPVRGAGGVFTAAGVEVDAGRVDEAVKIIGEFYRKYNAGELEPAAPRRSGPREPQEGELTWDLARELTEKGHEFSSHMVTHPYMSALDEANIMYELEASRAEIRNQIDVRSTIATEMPYGTPDKRAIGYVLRVYPASRNAMGLDYLHEIHRGDPASPIRPEDEYVQWQRGILSRTTLAEMNGWVDTAAEQENLWLVTVIHGIDGVGWEAMTAADVEAHFGHIADSRDDVWVATFGDAARYIKERMSAVVTAEVCVPGNCPCGCECGGKCGAIVVKVDHPLDKELFDLPLTLRTAVDPSWEEVRVITGKGESVVPVMREGAEAWVMYCAVAGETVKLKKK